MWVGRWVGGLGGCLAPDRNKDILAGRARDVEGEDKPVLKADC